MSGERDPQLRKRVSRRRIKTLWAARSDLAIVRDDIGRFREDTALLGEGAEADDGAKRRLVSKVNP